MDYHWAQIRRIFLHSRAKPGLLFLYMIHGVLTDIRAVIYVSTYMYIQ